GRRFGRQGELVHWGAVAFARERNGDKVVTNETAIFYQVVVGEVAPHPRGHHHRGGDFDRAIHFGEVVPDVVPDFEGGGPRFFLGFVDANQGVLRPPRPDLQR